MSNKAGATKMKSTGKRELKPRLRFPEFHGNWVIQKLDDIADIITEKAGNKKCSLMSVTQGVGLITQIEKFGREIAGEQYKNYFVIGKNDFAYNKSATKEYPQGFIAMYSGKETAAVPNSIFTCFTIHIDKIFPQFLNYQFLENLHGRWLKKYITVGARAHGSLNINDSDLLLLPIPMPKGETSLKEQQKIADCLSSIDELIAAQTQKLDTLKAHKKGLMRQLFPAEGETLPKLRFPEFRDAPEWKIKHLKSICHMQAGKFISSSDIFEQYEKGLYPCYGGNGLRGYSRTYTHSGIYPLIGRQGALCGNITLGIGQFHATEHAIVTAPKDKIDMNWLFYALIVMNLNKYATGQAQPGLSVEALEKFFIAVSDKEKEQQKIANCLSSIDELIAAQTQKLDTLKAHKKGLMQQLFPSPEEAWR
ncbi:MAG: restriction endonuclease subunit S [Candidatus Adiutrix sp.]|jgi:type I restriction enzyme S subunit|nr:restriction endonuclease subunit S [Candidatus Adiutrix sp.]